MLLRLLVVTDAADFADRGIDPRAWRREAAAEIKPPNQLLSYQPGRFVVMHLWLIVGKQPWGGVDADSPPPSTRSSVDETRSCPATASFARRLR